MLAIQTRAGRQPAICSEIHQQPLLNDSHNEEAAAKRGESFDEEICTSLRSPTTHAQAESTLLFLWNIL
ncbi:hypothetical protein PBY51_010768 [Eleginops maclovinus]|uniref:Uncharacterized protein n=1 Tax=Eleginops maclovinus TaxID=56733 RepID=A0AAN8AJJ6_ELEMC|nr:hypothetical protein PBY51_010768 [Eleginops maclovinus]